MRFCRHLGALALAAAFAISPASATVWTENNAGDLPGSAEVTVGAGALTQILGHLAFNNNTSLWGIDLYLIRIVDPGLFSAQTVGGGSNVADPVLFLFGSDGRGIVMNDDTSNTDLQSTIPAGGPLAAGLYYLGVAWAFSDPQSVSGAIFPVYEQFLDPAGVYGATGSGGADPLVAWLPGGPPNFDLFSDYSILLTGAAAAAVPEPNTLALLAMAFVTIGALARRRRVL